MAGGVVEEEVSELPSGVLEYQCLQSSNATGWGASERFGSGVRQWVLKLPAA